MCTVAAPFGEPQNEEGLNTSKRMGQRPKEVAALPQPSLPTPPEARRDRQGRAPVCHPIIHHTCHLRGGGVVFSPKLKPPPPPPVCLPAPPSLPIPRRCGQGLGGRRGVPWLGAGGFACGHGEESLCMHRVGNGSRDCIFGRQYLQTQKCAATQGITW